MSSEQQVKGRTHLFKNKGKDADVSGFSCSYGTNRNFSVKKILTKLLG